MNLTSHIRTTSLSASSDNVLYGYKSLLYKSKGSHTARPLNV